MVKKLTLLTILLSFFFIASGAHSQTPSTTPATTQAENDQNLIDQINNLKEKVASKVAELRLVEKRGIIGVVDEVNGNKITVIDIQNANRFIDVDELTKFSSPTAKDSFGISDITKGTKISAVGLYNKQTKRILARFIHVYTIPTFVSGNISDIDKVNFTITVTSEDNVPTTVDIENVTKTSEYTEEDGITRLGFSKLQIGERVYVVGFPVKDAKNRITGTRVTVFPELPKNPHISPEASDTSSDTATGSGIRARPTE